MVLIIGISGKKGVGKDYVTRHVLAPMFVRRGYRVTTMAFADALKVFLCTSGQSTINELFANRKTDRTRELLQTVGTDIVRESHRKDWWIRQLDAWIDVRLRRDPVDVVFVPDVRFKNEYAWIKAKGGVLLRIISAQDGTITVNKDAVNQHSGGYVNYVTGLFKQLWYGNDSTANHISETDLCDSDFEHTVLNPHNGDTRSLTRALSGFEAEAVRTLQQ